MSAEPPPGEPKGFLGPVEPGEGTWTPLRLYVDEPPRLLSRRLKAVLVLLLLALALLLTARHAMERTAAAANSPPPEPAFPSQSTRFQYGGKLPVGQESFALSLTVHNAGTGPVDVLGVSQGYRGLSVVVGGWLPQTVPPGQTVSLRVGLKVTDCSAAPADAGLPFLDVTLRNTRALETTSQILGDSYARDLSAALHATCDTPDNRTPTTSPSSSDIPVR
ncbi:Tat pathway signal sequence domain protein [Kitasatospora sp. CB02891]|uniref:Tat pathway signal sequence domain protein n=1 Tax=Kitasatospora sp. CB02891 TaxID=2020329 RepID=UPI000C27E301|nr:Tat pathway signal sequence domain protein [Kitasatospora sp. CB02891]PJN25048.1 Tat pathway signal sequence domain protein [Kitasatospora sp. CB02891]